MVCTECDAHGSQQESEPLSLQCAFDPESSAGGGGGERLSLLVLLHSPELKRGSDQRLSDKHSSFLLLLVTK